MQTDAASRFLDQLINNPQLRSKFREDPEGTMIEAGLDERERKNVSDLDLKNVPDQELAQRVSKYGGYWSDGRLKQDVATLQGSLAKLRTLYGS